MFQVFLQQKPMIEFSKLKVQSLQLDVASGKLEHGYKSSA